MPHPFRRPVLLGSIFLILLLGMAFRVFPALDYVYPEVSSEGSRSASDAPRIEVVVPSALPTTEPREIRLFGTDSWYHLRHARLAAADFPHLQRQDLWVNYPEGYRAPEVGLYALGLATAATVLDGGAPSDRRLQEVAAWAPPILGVAVLGAIMILGGSLWGWSGALLSGALLLLYPGGLLTQSLLGMNDHHVVETLLLLLVMLGLHRLLLGIPEGDDGELPLGPLLVGRPSNWISALLAALPLVLFHFTWNGAPAYLLFSALALFGAGAAGFAVGVSEKIGVRIFRFGVVFTLLTGVIGGVAPVLVQVPEIFPSILLLGGGIAIGLGGLFAIALPAVARRTGYDRATLASATLVLGLALLGGALLLSPQGRWVWTILTERRTATVSEHDLAFDLATFMARASVPGVIALAAPVVAASVLVRERSFAWVAPLTLAILAVAFWTGTGDFAYIVPPAVSLLATFVLVRGAGALLERILDSAPRRILGGAAVAVLLAVPLFGFGGVAHPWPASSYLSGLMLYNEGWDQALGWLRARGEEEARMAVETEAGSGAGEEASPAGAAGAPRATTSSPAAGRVTPIPGTGVLASWDFGNFVTEVARRPVLWSQGPDERTIGWFLARGEDAAAAVLSGVEEEYRYIVADARTVSDFFMAKATELGVPQGELQVPLGTVEVRGRRVSLASFGAPFEESMGYRLYYQDGVELERHRLVYRTPHRSLSGYLAIPGGATTSVGRVARALDTDAARAEAERYLAGGQRVIDFGEQGLLYLPRIEPSVKIFERVEGAVISGRAEPGARVMAQLELHSGSDGVDLEYRRTVTADREGRYAIRVPYATDADRVARDGVGATGPYRIYRILSGEEPTEDGRVRAQVLLLAPAVTVSEEAVRRGREIEVR